MSAILIFMGFIVLCAGLSSLTRKLTKNMREDYEYMLSERESRDTRQSMSDKVHTSIGGNDFVDSMVNVSIMDYNNED